MSGGHALPASVASPPLRLRRGVASWGVRNGSPSSGLSDDNGEAAASHRTCTCATPCPAYPRNIARLRTGPTYWGTDAAQALETVSSSPRAPRIAIPESRDRPERPAGADPRLLALCPCQIALCSSLIELDAQFGRFVLRRRHGVARLYGCCVCLGHCLLGCGDVAFGLGDVLVRDDVNLIGGADLLHLCSGSRRSFGLRRCLCLGSLRRGFLVFKIRVNLHGPDGEPDRGHDRNARDDHPHYRPLPFARRRAGRGHLGRRAVWHAIVWRRRGRVHRVSLSVSGSNGASSSRLPRCRIAAGSAGAEPSPSPDRSASSSSQDE